MNERLAELSGAYNTLTLRERAIIVVAILVSLVILWWHFFASPLMQQSRELEQTNARLVSEIQAATLANQAITQRLAEGVHKEKLAQIERHQDELQRVNAQLEEKAFELVEPDEMFDLMGQLVFSDSGLKLGVLKRKEVTPVFSVPDAGAQQADDQPTIYRHTMTVNLRGGYAQILRYVKSIEQTDWKLIWDSIRLQTEEYPSIDVELELSTLSKSKQWVGL